MADSLEQLQLRERELAELRSKTLHSLEQQVGMCTTDSFIGRLRRQAPSGKHGCVSPCPQVAARERELGTLTEQVRTLAHLS
jgi:hypothetical protein